METLGTGSQRSVILTVDDDEDDIDLMRLLFRKAGVSYPVEIFRKGEDFMDALAAVVRDRATRPMPLVCFVDIKMPSIGGHEIVTWIRKHRELDDLSVVMLSSSDHPDDIKQAARNGAQCYLFKYPHPGVLKRVLEEAERMSRQGTSVAREWFGLPANLLLRWGFTNTRSAAAG